MKKQVIAAVNMTGELASFTDARRFELYEKKQSKWRKADSYELLNKPETVQTFRDTIVELSAHFQSCRVVVSQKASGIAYQTLDRSGYAIFEADTLTDRLLDGVLCDIEAAQAVQDTPPMEPFSPNGDGNYFFDLARLQKTCPGVSSKKALMNFMRTSAFLSFELVCDHLPPWMEDVMKQKGLEYRTQRENGLSRVTISKRMCQ
jgi:hypothetical protein